MLKAIYKKTGEIVSAFKLENDITWVGKEKEEWVVPSCDVEDYQEKGEAKAFFTKSHIREGNIYVVAHFKHESNRLIKDYHSESNEHILAKEGVYESICNGNLLLDGKPLKELIQDIEPFEYPISKSKKSKIADVIALFKEWHPVYGKGIVFEIQFSNQISEITEDRTFNRLSEGYSVCWLWDGDFKNNKLKLERVKIIPFTTAIDEYAHLTKNKTEKELNLLGQLSERKVIWFKEEASKIITNFREAAKLELNYLDKIKEDLDLETNSKIGKVYEKIDKLVKYIDDIKDRIELDILEKTSFDIKELSEKLKLQLSKEYCNAKDELVSKSLKSIREDAHIYNQIILQVKDDLKSSINQELEKVISNTVKELSEEFLNRSDIKDIAIKAIEKKIGIDIGHSISCTSCKQSVLIKSSEFQNGMAYCSACFDSLPSNWKKEANKNMNKTYMEYTQKKLDKK